MSPNLESCKTAKCGAGRKCIQRNEKPKCVCAPNCKASKGQQNVHKSNSKRTLRFVGKKDRNENVKVISGMLKKRKTNSQRTHLTDTNEDVDFVEPTNSSSKFDKSQRIILSDSKLLNKIHGDRKTRINFNRNFKNEFINGNYGSVNDSNRSKDQKLNRHGTHWPSMIRTGSYGYDSPFPPNQFAVKFVMYIITYISQANHIFRITPTGSRAWTLF